MKFINLTRRTEIGANSYYIETGGHRLVLDCGMHPKNVGEDALPNLKPIADRQLGAILISHSHQDHIGTLPVLMRRQPNARVFMASVTMPLTRLPCGTAMAPCTMTGRARCACTCSSMRLVLDATGVSSTIGRRVPVGMVTSRN